MANENNPEKLIPTITEGSVIIMDDALYPIKLFDLDKELEKNVAYVKDEYFYLFRGAAPQYGSVKPGIYMDDKTNKYYVVEPKTDEEKAYYNYLDKIGSYDAEAIVDLVNNNDDLFIPVSDSVKIFNPEITCNDNVLKRLLKAVFVEKDLDIDSCKDRFPDKNSVFNFKQVMKKEDAPVTWKIFERAADAVNLKYVIYIEEKDPTKSVGKRLAQPICVSSEDTYADILSDTEKNDTK